MRLTGKILIRILVSITLVGVGAGAIHHLEAKSTTVRSAREQLRFRARLLASLVERDLDSIVFLARQLAGRDDIARLLRGRATSTDHQAIERALREQTASHEVIDAVDLFAPDGSRLASMRRSEFDESTSAHHALDLVNREIGDGASFSWREDAGAQIIQKVALDDHRAGALVVTLDLDTLIRDSVELASRDLEGTGVQILYEYGTPIFTTGVRTDLLDNVVGSASTASFPGTINFVQRYDKAMAAFLRGEMLLLGVGAVLLIVLLLLIWISIRDSVLKPVSRIIGLVRSFEEGRPLPARPRNDASDELSGLEWSIHGAIRGWVESKRRLNDLADSLETRVASRTDALKSQAEELRLARRAAENANRSKSEFLANMSHEIRTPMTAIMGYTDLLADPGRDKDHDAEYIQTIQRNGEHLLTIINDILDISKIEAGKMEVEQIPCDPWHIVDEVRALMQVRADERGLQLLVQHEGLIPESITSDPTRLRQILTNLVSNSIKFTESGSIHLRFGLIDPPTANEPRMRFVVHDTGIGMDQEQRSRLFQPFMQADSSMSRRFGGTGLGLTICKRLAELLGGGIEVASTPGEGSTFTVTIRTGNLRGVRLLDASPRSSAKDAASQAGGSSARPNAFDDRNDTRPAPHDQCEHPSASDASNALNEQHDSQPRGRILLAEDGPDNQRLLSFLLRKAGFAVEIAENGRVALERIVDAMTSDVPFDIVLMDMQMPVMDGYTATRHLRDAGYTGPVIALTAHAMAGDRARCEDAGCDDYATKPIDRVALISLLERHLGRSATGGSTDRSAA